jgi:hypothetical protein
MNLTPEMEIGTKFEILLECYFRGQKDKNGRKFQQVMRNVDYYKNQNEEGQYVHRQADLVFSMVNNNRIYRILVEAKYSSNGPIQYDLRSDKDKVESDTTLTNLVDEILERQRFIGAYRSILATNNVFEDRLRREAKRNGIILLDKDILFREYKRLGGVYTTLEDSIRAVDLTDPKKHNLKRNRIYCG